MTFDDILTHVLALLQRHGRVSYRALKARFGLTDEYLEAVKDELIHAQHLAVDEASRVLVWTGALSTSPTPRPADASGAAPGPRADTPSLLLLPPGRASLPGERRQVTIVFADIAGFTALSEQRDPEEVRQLINACFAQLVPIIERYGGTIDKFIGDAIMALFGAPVAHEKDADRAVRAALEMMDALTMFNRKQGTDLGLHCGINTGLVIAGSLGTASRHDYSVMGDAVNVAARLEDAAERGQILVGPETYRLTRASFTFAPLAPMPLKGKAEPVPVYQVAGLRHAQTGLQRVARTAWTSLVGRAAETSRLLEHWDHVTQGRGQVLVLSGEAGIGKSRLLQVFTDQLKRGSHVRLDCRCSPYHQQTPFYPLIDLWQRLLRWESNQEAASRLTQLEHVLASYALPLAETVPMVAALLALAVPEDRYPPVTASHQHRQRTMDVCITVLHELATRQPVLVAVEDLHWADPSTLELLGRLIAPMATTRALLVLTCRPEFVPPWAPHAHLSHLPLTRLPPPQVAEMIARVTGGKALPAVVVEQIVTHTDGVPLFVEELVKTILEAGLVRAEADHYVLTGPLPPLAIPTTLQDALMARLDRLASVKGVAQLGATLGREFSYAVLQAVAALAEPVLQQSLAQLVAAELLYQQGVPPQATYTFKHALIQEVAYQSLLRSTRHQVHYQIAQVLEAQFPELVATQPELLAHHLTAAGCHAQAVGYWQRAGEGAVARSAHLEAISHLTQGLAGLQALPETPERLQQELGLQTTLGPALMLTRGFAAPEVEHAYARARALCQWGGETPQRFAVLRGLWQFYNGRGDYQTARELGEQCLQLAQQGQDTARLVEAHHTLWTTRLLLGELSRARGHLEQGLALYDPQQHRALAVRYGHDPGVCCQGVAALTLWLLGYPDQARRQQQAAHTLGQEVAHPPSLAFTQMLAALTHQLRREAHAAHGQAEALLALATEQEFALFEAIARILRGAARRASGPREEQSSQIRQGLAAVRATGTALWEPYFLALLAEAYGHEGQVEAGLTALAEALTAAQTTGERWGEAELHRLQGELLLALSAEHHQAEAERCFHHAVAVARQQQAKSLELRAALSLSRLWQQQGKRTEARALLAPVYGWFTEGFDTVDLQEAQALLEALGG